MEENDCDSEKIETIKNALTNILTELNKIGKPGFNNKAISQRLIELYSKINQLCLVSLGFDYPYATTLANTFLKNATQLGTGITGPARKMIPNIQNLLESLESFNHESSPLSSPSNSQPPPTIPTLFPSHKYLDLSDESEFDIVKSKYKKLAKLYHSDGCPNENTPGMTKEQCDEEFKILSNEYQEIKSHFGISGGKKYYRKNTNKKYRKRTNKKYRKSYKKNIRTKTKKLKR